MRACSSCGREIVGDFAFCPYCGAELLKVGPVGERRKTVTVLFCDVTGSTALGESLDPEALRRLLARYFERMRGIVERYGGTVEKFIGDRDGRVRDSGAPRGRCAPGGAGRGGNG